MTTQDSAFEEIRKLAQEFRTNERFYLSLEYQESQARKDFIDKFLIALGWDVNHDTQKNPFEQEAKVERGVNVLGVQRRADYAFYLSPDFRDVRFFVEAKKPQGELATPDNYFQTLRYGWNAQTSLAVLTNFAQFHVLDCRYKPDIKTVLQCAVKTYHYSDYDDAEKFAEIYYLFSREAVAAGSLEKFTDSLVKRRGKAVQKGAAPGAFKSIDDAFLEELDEHRHDLAHLFKGADASLDGETLTEITQRTLDRLVFTRFLEDRQIESEPSNALFGEEDSAWDDFLAESRRLDAIYNGVVFKKHAILDAPGFKIDDKRFAEIRDKLSHRNSPYDFNIIPIHILGSIYERFLGKVIMAGDKRVRVEEKPEVRKAGGVYYTPQYIVTYIVENTVGKMIDGKTPEQIAKMRFADISCGSGSFLLGVFDTLLAYHRRYYNVYRSKAKKEDCVERDGVLYLTLKKRRQILLNNIYGVDIDAQAVEVTQLSLYLKLLEEETIGTTHEYQQEFHETLLPSLGKNIVCGNSLIGTDILTGELFGGDEERKLNPMDFEARFPEIMRRGGFDVIIGNPPWISLSGKFGNEIYPQSAIDYLKRRFHGNTYMPNMYEYFVAKGLSIVRDSGFFSFIVPDRLGFNSQFIELRKRMLQESQIISLKYKAPFPGITADTLIFVTQKGNAAQDHLIEISEFEKSVLQRPQAELLRHPMHSFEYYQSAEIMQLILKIESLTNISLIESICDSTSGFGGKSELIASIRSSKSQIPTLKGDSIGRYEMRKGYWFEFKKDNITGRTTDKIKLGASEKILIRKTGDRIIATYDDSGIFPEQSLYFLYGNRTGMSLKFLLGVLNSRLLNTYYGAKCLTNKDSIAQVKKIDLDRLPIPMINLNDPTGKLSHDKIVQWVDAILGARKQLAEAKIDKDKTYYESKCAALDRQIDDLIYKLYGLTDDEIHLVEESIK